MRRPAKGPVRGQQRNDVSSRAAVGDQRWRSWRRRLAVIRLFVVIVSSLVGRPRGAAAFPFRRRSSNNDEREKGAACCGALGINQKQMMCHVVRNASMQPPIQILPSDPSASSAVRQARGLLPHFSILHVLRCFRPPPRKAVTATGAAAPAPPSAA